MGAWFVCLFVFLRRKIHFLGFDGIEDIVEARLLRAAACDPFDRKHIWAGFI